MVVILEKKKHCTADIFFSFSLYMLLNGNAFRALLFFNSFPGHHLFILPSIILLGKQSGDAPIHLSPTFRLSSFLACVFIAEHDVLKVCQRECLHYNLQLSFSLTQGNLLVYKYDLSSLHLKYSIALSHSHYCHCARECVKDRKK